MLKKSGLRKKLEHELFEIRKAYEKALKEQTSSTRDEWLCDNYYILEREGRSVLKDLKTCPRIPLEENNIQKLFYACLDVCAGGALPSQEELIKRFSSSSLQGSEAEALNLMLRCALIHTASEGCRKSAEEGAGLLGSSVKSFRSIQDIDFGEVLEKTSEIEKILSRDPAGVYTAMDEQTRAMYRSRLAKSAHRHGVSEEQEAKDILEMARNGPDETGRHVGSYIVKTGRYRRRGTVFLLIEALLPLAAAVAAGLLMKKPYLTVLLFFPLWEIFRPFIEIAAHKGVEAHPLSRLDLKGAVPDNARTLITVSTLLPGADKAGELKKRLLDLWHSNGRENIKICLLADLKGADTPEKPEDRAAVAAAKMVVAELNKEYAGGFILAVRPRVYSPTQGNFTGRERKRGAITELVKAIKGSNTEFTVLFGDVSTLNQTRYILALDSDTFLPMDTAAELISVALHPLNIPRIDTAKGRVVSGYGILAPKVETELSGAGATSFAKILAGEGGISTYDTFTTERYQDLFGEGIFAGKGLLDVNAYHTLLPDVFPPEQVLSHDILEGGYLRAGFVSDLQVADGFPKREGAYLDRLNRWVRGDWQNIRFLFGRNSLNALSRYKLFDNLRRSINPVAAFAGILLSIWMPLPEAVFTVLVCLFSASGGNLFSAVRASFAGGPAMFSRLYYSGAMPAALGAIVQGFVLLMMLPQTAYVCLDAIIRANWRTFISKKKRLEWTTAAQSDKAQDILSLAVRYIPTIAAGALLLFLGGSLHRLAGILFILNFPFAVLSGKEKRTGAPRFDYLSRERLTSYAAAMWRYFEEFCTAENNYLPPDNIQETPVHAVAHRTSPTNIGLMLLCTLAARDFGFIGSLELCARLNSSLNSIDKLEKWKGNLLNWYSTLNLKPLDPRYVSTVDSGNFLCSIVALRQGLLEYAGEHDEIRVIVDRLTAIIENCDIGALYNPRRKLFHIGYDLSADDYSSSYYDLLMSEARMTGYYAIASRAVPKKHWGALGRTLARAGRYTGPVSWTGTMFEYFMPAIFLPEQEGSLDSEALRFCLWCQRSRTKNLKINGQSIPWGISESGFYAFDRQLNYQYKAHGVQKLGLKRGLNAELVISPYSSFLVMNLAPREAIKNLKALERMEMTGRCGFYEAADFTASRTGGQDYAVVRSYMAHHVGMSMLCVLNALKDNLIQKRFMSDDSMAAAFCLLQEKTPAGAVVFKDVVLREVPRTRERTEPQSREFETISPVSPHMKLLTNGEWTLGITDAGASVSLYRGASIIRHSPDLLRRPSGVFAFFRSGEKVLPFINAADYGFHAEFGAEFEEKRVMHTARSGAVGVRMISSVHLRLPCEQRRFSVKNNSSKDTLAGHLYLYFEPSLAIHAEEEDHPAFSKLFLTDRFDRANRLLLFTRRPRNGKNPLCLAAGIAEDVEFSLDTSRERLLDCGDGIPSLLRNKEELKPGRGSPDACAAFCVRLKIPPKGRSDITLLLCAASTESEAVARFIKAREEGIVPADKGAPCPFDPGGIDGVIADRILPLIFYYTRRSGDSIEAAARNTLGRQSIWSFGLSADNPIMLIEVHNPEDVARAVPYIRLNKKLRYSGIATDVVIAFKEGGDYDTPIMTAVRAALKKEGCEQSLGVNGGVHAIDLTMRNEEERVALRAAAVFIAPVSAERFSLPVKEYKPVSFLAPQPLRVDMEEAYRVKGGVFTPGRFTVEKKAGNPCVPWCFVLSNQSFGTLASDKSLGFTWAINSRENKLTPWYNDTRTDNRGEMLILKINGKYYDLCSSAAAEFNRGYVRWTGRADSVDYQITVRVPHSGMCKFCRLKLANTAKTECKATAAYYIEPVLGVNRSTSRFIKSSVGKNGITLTSPWSEIPGFVSFELAGGTDFICCSRESFLSGNWNTGRKLPLTDPCAAIGRAVTLPPGDEIELDFSLSFGRTEDSAVRIGSFRLQSSPAENKPGTVAIETPDEALDHMFNTFLPAQILGSRFYGRTGFYQCGGAWGFRDQLQDASALVLTHPNLVRAHIMRCAAVQFEQGDVLHWWHRLPKAAGGLRGVRTRYSDDLLWLPLITAEYVRKTGDTEFLKIRAPYITGEELREDEHERYFYPGRSAVRTSIYEHCVRAVERASRFGENGLPLIGGGDWNDGFNLVGIRGRGESVWLAQFLAMVLEEMAPLCGLMDEAWRAADYRELAERLKTAVEEKAWAGDRYLRAFYDDGSAMGCAGSQECEIDSLPQSFAVLSGMKDTSRRRLALENAVRRLVDEKNGLIKLLSPPFTGSGKTPGYIASYPPGIRENGGQYTHAAVWLAIALLREGMANEGYRLLKLLNPASFCADTQRAGVYRAEPYALAGDICSAPGVEGRAGWSLYTGAAAWYYRAVMEELLGVKLENGSLLVRPVLPVDWSGYRAVIKAAGTAVSLTVRNKAGAELFVDGKAARAIPLDGSKHEAEFA